MPYSQQATKEETKTLRKKCFTCKKRGWIKDWTGWNMCFGCWRRDYKYGRCHGLWQALKDLRINV